MAQHAQLKAETRTMLGKKVRRLRATGVLPATVYGHNVIPQSIQLDLHDFHQALKHAGRTQLIDLSIGEQRARPVFVKQTTVDAKRNAILHVEFFQANLREKLHTSVPVHFVGESQAIKDGGIFLGLIDHIDVESLPDDVPESIEVDLSQLIEINSAIHVSDMHLPVNVAVLLPADEMIAKVNPPISQEALDEALGETEPLPSELGGDQEPADAVPEA